MDKETLLEIIVRLGKIAEERLETAEDSNQQAFLFGHLNLAACVLSAHEKNNGTVHIGLNYKEAFKAYKEAKKESDTEEDWHQISIEELFDALEQLKNKHKKSTKKKSTNKE